MILVVGLLTLLVASSTGAQRIKGGPALIQGVADPHIHVGKGGGGGAVHHTEVVQDPLSGHPVVVEKVTSLGSGGIKTAALGGGAFGPRGVYRVGQSQIPFGLLGSDYFSYPTSLLTAPRAIGGKTVLSDNLSGLAPVGRTIIAGPVAAPFSVGDAQIQTNVFGARRPIYRTGISSIPYGLSGLDYFSYPNQLLNQRGLGFTAGDAQIRGPIITAVDSSGLGAHIGGFGQRQVAITKSAPAAVIHAPAPVRVVQAAAPVQVVHAPAPVRVVQAPAPVQVVHAPAPVRVVQAQAPVRVVQAPAPVRVVQAPAPVRVAPAPVRVVQAPAPVQYVHAPAPVRYLQAPAPAPVRYVQAPAPAPVRYVQAPAPAPVRYVQAPAPAPVRYVQAPAPIQYAHAPAPVQVLQAPVQRRVIARRPQEVFLSHIGQPGLGGLGNIQFTLGGNQLIGGHVVAPGPIVHAAPGPIVHAAPAQVIHAAPAPIVRAAPARVVHTAPAPILNAAPVISAAPRQIIAAAPRQVIAAAPRRVVSVAPQPVITAVHQPVIAHAPAVVAAPTPIIATRPQVISKINTAGLGHRNSIFGNRTPQLVYLDGGRRFPGIDIIGGSRIGDPRLGYTQLPISTSRFATLGSIPSKIGGLASGGLAAVGGPTKIVTQEEVVGPAGDPQIITTVTESHPSTVIGGIHGPIGTTIQEHLTDAALGGGSAQVHIDDGLGAGGSIADAIVQENIASGLGSSGLRFSPRMSFLSSFPYDAPDSGLLRSVISRPVVQQQQVEQILV